MPIHITTYNDQIVTSHLTHCQRNHTAFHCTSHHDYFRWRGCLVHWRNPAKRTVEIQHNLRHLRWDHPYPGLRIIAHDPLTFSYARSTFNQRSQSITFNQIIIYYHHSNHRLVSHRATSSVIRCQSLVEVFFLKHRNKTIFNASRIITEINWDAF